MAVNLQWGTYSFQDFIGSISGPGGTFTIGGLGDAAAEEGMTIAWNEETNTQTIGADGSVMNSLHASHAGTLTVRLLKISYTNALLNAMYNYQRSSSAYWGQNIVTMQDIARGDNFTLSGCAFVRHAQLSWAKVGPMLDWEFHVAIIDPTLGKGILRIPDPSTIPVIARSGGI